MGRTRVIEKAAEAVGKVAGSSGKRLRWSTRNSVTGLVVVTACEQIVANGISWEGVTLAFIGLLPLAIGRNDN